MTQDAGIKFKSTDSRPKRKSSRKLSLGLWVIVLAAAGYCYWQYLGQLTHVRAPVKLGRSAAAAIAPTADKLKMAAGLPKPGDQPVPATTNNPVSTEAAGNFADSLMSVLSPSVEAETIQPKMPPVFKPAKRMTAPTIAPVPSGRRPLAPHAEQKMLKVAEDGFVDVISLAYRYPAAYGFTSDESLGTARLGDPIPVYMIAPEDRESYMGQAVGPLLKPADEWIFPIILDNRVRFMVQVRYNGHDYVLGHGSRALAVVYDKILARWPANEGFHPQLIVNPDMPFFFFTIPELPDPNLTDTSRMLDFDPVLSPAAVILASWR